jgi:hypothetical protein
MAAENLKTEHGTHRRLCASDASPARYVRFVKTGYTGGLIWRENVDKAVPVVLCLIIVVQIEDQLSPRRY